MAAIPWHAEEKVDGTNIRCILDQERESVAFRGRTDRADITEFLLSALKTALAPANVAGAFANTTGESSNPNVVLYGEGYGARIQKGGSKYIPDGVGFCLFDVAVDGLWLRREDVYAIANKLGVPHPPSFGALTLADAESMVRAGFASRLAAVADKKAEGLILRPTLELCDRRGERIITKLKTKDYAQPR